MSSDKRHAMYGGDGIPYTDGKRRGVTPLSLRSTIQVVSCRGAKSMFEKRSRAGADLRGISAVGHVHWVGLGVGIGA
jgi:hypothetical protein